MDFRNRKNIIITVVFIIYSLFVMFLPLQVNDVNISIEYQEQPGGNYVAQLFYDNGNGYNAEDTIAAAIQDNRANLILQKDLVKTIKTVRLDPIDADIDLVITGIQINGKEMDIQHFSEWIAGMVQLEVSYEENNHALLFNAVENDPQIYFNENFTNEIKRGLNLQWNERLIFLFVGLILFGGILFIEHIWGIIKSVLGFFETFFNKHLKKNNWQTLLGLGLIIITTLFVMHDYLLGNKWFIFCDAADSVVQDYPNYLQLASNIENNMPQNTYTFAKVLGMGLGNVKVNLSNWVAYFGKDALPYLLGVSAALKIILSGVFFYLFLRIRGVKRWYSVVLSLGYAYCGHMVIRSAWISYPNEVVLVALGLFCIELLLQRKDWRWIIPMIFLFEYHFPLGGYYSVAYIGLTAGYVVFRIITEYKVNWKKAGVALAIIAVAAGVFLWITDFHIFKSIMLNLSSDRAQNNIQMLLEDSELYRLDLALLPRILARTVGVATIGIIGNNYTGGYISFLEDPTFYCGIFVLILLPIAFYSMKWKQRIWYSLGYLLAATICLFPPIRLIANGFSGVTFKLFSFWIIIFILYTAAQINWDKVSSEKGRRISSLLCVFVTGIWELIIFFLPKYIECIPNEIYKSMIFCALDGLVVLWIINQKNTRMVSKAVFVVFVCIEVSAMSYPIYVDRQTADKDIYNDGTEHVLQWIEEIEGDSFYRIDKQYLTVGECDSIAQGYNGTAYYVGGIGIISDATLFYNDLGLPGNVNDNRKAYGTSMQNEVETLLGIKYALTKDQDVPNFGYKKVYEYGNINVFENEYVIPFGFVYEKAIERSTFEQLDMNQRQQVLLQACLVEDGESEIPLIEQEKIEELKTKESLFDKYEISYSSTEEGLFYYNGDPEYDFFSIEPNTEEELIAIQVTFDKAGKGNIYYSTQSGETYSFVIEQELESSGQIYEITVSNVDKIWWVSPNWANITSLRIAKIPQKEYYQGYVDSVNQLRENSVQITSYTDNEIWGYIDAKNSGMLYLPAVAGEWYINIDDEFRDVKKINDAFIGVYVEEGPHSIGIIHPVGTSWDVYRPERKKMIISFLCIMLGTFWINYKKKRGTKNEGYIGSRTVTK